MGRENTTNCQLTPATIDRDIPYINIKLISTSVTTICCQLQRDSWLREPIENLQSVGAGLFLLLASHPTSCGTYQGKKGIGREEVVRINRRGVHRHYHTTSSIATPAPENQSTHIVWVATFPSLALQTCFKSTSSCCSERQLEA